MGLTLNQRIEYLRHKEELENLNKEEIKERYLLLLSLYFGVQNTWKQITSSDWGKSNENDSIFKS